MRVNPSLPVSRLVGTATLSASALLLEIALTRLFSVLYFPPYVFLIISVAILGIGIGAALPLLRPALLDARRLPLYCVGACSATFLIVLLAVIGAASAIQIPLFAVLALPYICFGLAMASLFSRHVSASRTLYMSDLLGAGIGALLALPLLNAVGAVNAVLAVALGFGASALVFAAGRQSAVALTAFGMAAAALVINVASGLLQVNMANLTDEKPIVSALAEGGSIVETRWDAFARTDLLKPADGSPLRIYVDGGAASIMPSPQAAATLMRDLGFFAFATEQPESVYVLGPGAGLDVFYALQAGARAVTAVEVNAASVDLSNAWRAYNGGIYQGPEVDIIIDDGRSALRRSGAVYDLIYLSQVVTLAAERGGYALSENAIYTVDAFTDYLAQLADDGQIALKLYDEITLTRALTTAIVALSRQGLSDAEALQHLMAFVDERSNPAVPLLLIGASPFDEDDSLVLGAIAREVGFTPLLLPHVLVQAPLDAVANGTRTIADIVAASESDISAPTDDRPYFFQFERGIPTSLMPLVALVSAITVGLLVIYLSRLFRAQSRNLPLLPPFVALLGIGFISIEIFAIQQTRLFLGHPTLAVTLVLLTFLVGGGAGSGLSQLDLLLSWRRKPELVTALIVVLLLFWLIVWSRLSHELVAAELPIRALTAVVSLLPLTFVLGIPFPQALEGAGQVDRRQVALAWSVNGVMTVVGSVASVVLSITVGFSAVLWLGAVAYALATGVLLLWRRQAQS